MSLDPAEAVSGVPQDPALGPLYSIFINVFVDSLHSNVLTADIMMLNNISNCRAI
jgi:hypothetical protein